MSLRALLRHEHRMRFQRYDVFGGFRDNIEAIIEVYRQRGCPENEILFRVKSLDCALSGLEGWGEYFEKPIPNGVIPRRGYVHLRGRRPKRELQVNAMLYFERFYGKESRLVMKGVYGFSFETDLEFLSEFTLDQGQSEDEQVVVRQPNFLTLNRFFLTRAGGSGGDTTNQTADPKPGPGHGSTLIGTSTTSYPDV